MDDVNIGECFIEDRLVRQREVEIEPLGNRSHDGDVMLGHIEAIGVIRAKGHADDLMALLAQGIRIAQRRRGCAIGADGISSITSAMRMSGLLRRIIFFKSHCDRIAGRARDI